VGVAEETAALRKIGAEGVKEFMKAEFRALTYAKIACPISVRRVIRQRTR
jgi:hypothetical protein